MSRKKNRGIESPDLRYRNNNVNWQSADLNKRAYNRYLDHFLHLAINRFRWLNLPKGVDERYLEWILARSGNAVIFKIKDFTDRAYATKVVGLGPLNVYDNPTQFRSVGNNGWNVALDNSTAVLIWNSRTRLPLWSTLEYYAMKMADLDRTVDVNLKNQKTPYIITGPEEKQQEIINFYKQLDGNEPAIFGIDSLTGANGIKIEVSDTKVPFIGHELQSLKREYMNEVYEYLGIASSNTQKKERLIEVEVEMNEGPTEIMRLDGLNARRDAVKKFNEMYGTNIEVVWREDQISSNYNTLTSVKEKAELDLVGGETNGSEL